MSGLATLYTITKFNLDFKNATLNTRTNSNQNRTLTYPLYYFKLKYKKKLFNQYKYKQLFGYINIKFLSIICYMTLCPSCLILNDSVCHSLTACNECYYYLIKKSFIIIGFFLLSAKVKPVLCTNFPVDRHLLVTSVVTSIKGKRKETFPSRPTLCQNTS